MKLLSKMYISVQEAIYEYVNKYLRVEANC